MRRYCKKGIRTIDWNEHLPLLGTVAVNFSASRSPITHSQFGALKVKDAVVDQFCERFGVRPSVDLERPSIRINVYVDQDQAAVSIDLAGQSLHRRGYPSERVGGATQGKPRRGYSAVRGLAHAGDRGQVTAPSDVRTGYVTQRGVADGG